MAKNVFYILARSFGILPIMHIPQKYTCTSFLSCMIYFKRLHNIFNQVERYFESCMIFCEVALINIISACHSHAWSSGDEYHCNPDRAPLKEVLRGQYNYREGGRQVLRQGAKGRRSRSCRCSKDPCAQKVSGGHTDPSPKYRWKVQG